MAQLDLATLVTKLKTDDSQYAAGMKRAQGETKNFAQSQKVIGDAAKVAFAAASAAAIAFVVDSGREFMQFEAQMGEVFSILPGISEEAMSQMEDDVLAFAQEVGRTSDETIPALYQALSSGIPQSNVFEFMKIASDAALGGVTDLETAVDGITSVINAYGAEAISAQQASDLMFTATVGGKTTFDELSRSLYNVIPTAASLQVEFGNITAALATMTAAGTPTSVATTQLRQLLIELSQAGGDASETFQEMAGVTFVEFIAQGGNLQEALQLMETAAENGNVRLSDLFSSVEAGNAALSLTGESTGKFAAELDAAANSAGATADAAAVMADTGQQAINELKSAFEALKITVGESLAPTVQEFAESATEQLSLMTSTTKLNEMAGELTDLGLSWSQVNEIVGDNKAQFDLWRTAADLEDDLARNAAGMRRMEIAAIGLNMGLSATPEIAGSVANGFQESASELDNFIEQMEQMTSDLPPVATGMEYWALATQEVTTATVENAEAVAEQDEALAGASEAVDYHTQQLQMAAEGEREMTFTTQASVTAAELAAEARREEAEATAEGTAALAGYFVAATQANEAVGFFATTTTEAGAVLVDTTASQDMMNEAVYEAAIAAGGSAEQLAILGLATGQLSEAEAEAALKSAILQAEIAALAAAYVAGDLSISELRTEMANMLTDVNNMDVSIGTATGTVGIFRGNIDEAGEAAITAAERIGIMRGEAEDVAGTYDLTFNITQNGSVPNVGEGGQAHGGTQTGLATGTEAWPGGGVWVGEQGPEWVNLPAGSEVIANEESMAMAGGGVYYISVDARGSNLSERQIERAVERALERTAREADYVVRTRG